MDYVKVRWLHQHASEPILLLSELDAERYEVRKVEVFADGHMGFASDHQTSGHTVLGERPVPPAADIAADPEFVVEGLDGREFEMAWRAAITGSRWKLQA
ncbi:hypothetical protein [Rhizobacter sp. OV335]|jgi:hypothetical protein|uniref:DUF6881 domain-containing protein n=1 Tax=Rhizobacter sp. OV335 TaxID=1500264 RepID=UPI00090F9A76|nr:hypothetical protein [Rhizobacter sp. OV335]SHM29767.1 hypothetical protein SAMN02787076_01004 [Rhizobacter sp. OV335]